MYLPATDNWAQNTVYNYYQNQIAQQVNQQYPNLPDQNKKILMDNQKNFPLHLDHIVDNFWKKWLNITKFMSLQLPP